MPPPSAPPPPTTLESLYSQAYLHLISCLFDVFEEHNGDDVVFPWDQDWALASMPYNQRLKGKVGPVGVYYPGSIPSIKKVLSCANTTSTYFPLTVRSGGHSYGAYSLGGALLPLSSPLDPTSSPFIFRPPISLPSKPKKTPPQPARPPLPISSINSSLPRPGAPSLVLDMHMSFSSIMYHPLRKTVRVGPGALLGSLNELLEKNGRVVPSGSCPSVGVGGQAGVGGFGLMSRLYGLLLDNMVEVEMILADGSSMIASETQNPDLFWAVRGAAPSFGIITSLSFRTHPAPPLITYFELTLLPRSLTSTPDHIARAAKLYTVFEEFGESAEAKARLGMSWHVTPEPQPGGVGGSGTGHGLKVEILGQWAHEKEEGDEDWEGVKRDLGRRLEALGEGWERGKGWELGERKLTYLESMHNVGGDWNEFRKRPSINNHESVNFYAKSLITKRKISEAAITQHLTHLFSLLSTYKPHIEWFVLSPFLGGVNSKITDPSLAATSSFAHRDLRIAWELYAKYKEGREGEGKVDLMGLVEGMMVGLDPVEAVYPAYVDPELPASLFPSLVWGKNYPRLQSLKAQYDPDDIFRSPQTVRITDVSRSSLPSSSSISIIALITFGCALIYTLRYASRKLRTRRKGKAKFVD